MVIGGFLPTTLLDYPEKLACTVFTCGCNFRCPFCHNASLVLGDVEQYDISDILERLKKRKNILEGVCITGGEPTLHKDLPDFIRSIKELGLLVKLDTNGSRPDVIKDLCHDHLIDYVAMDIKTSKENYPLVCGTQELPIAAIEESAEFLMHSGISHEFRTTLVKGLHTGKDMESISRWIKGAEKYYLQSYENSGQILAVQDPSSISAAGNAGITEYSLDAFPDEEMQHFLEIARRTIPNAALRGR